MLGVKFILRQTVKLEVWR